MPIWSPGRHIPTQKVPRCPPPREFVPGSKIDLDCEKSLIFLCKVTARGTSWFSVALDEIRFLVLKTLIKLKLAFIQITCRLIHSIVSISLHFSRLKLSKASTGIAHFWNVPRYKILLVAMDKTRSICTSDPIIIGDA